MNNNKIEQHIANAIEVVTPDIFDGVSNAVITIDERPKDDVVYKKARGNMKQFQTNILFKGGVIMNIKNISLRAKFLTGIFAALALCLTIFAGINSSNNKVASIINIDVNPSIEIKTNSENIVLSASALNEDAKIILDGMDLKNTKLDVAVNAIIGSMVKNGYIDEVKNAILVSVDNSDAAKTEEITKLISSNIMALLSESSISTVVYTQQFTENPTVAEIAAQYGISESKAEFISKLIEKNPSLDISLLAKMKIYELDELINTNNIDVSDIGNVESNKLNVNEIEAEEPQENEADDKNIKIENMQEAQQTNQDAKVEEKQENESEDKDVKIEDVKKDQQHEEDAEVEDKQENESEDEDIKVEDGQEDQQHEEDVKVEESHENESEDKDVKIEETHEKEDDGEDTKNEESHSNDSVEKESHVEED